LSFFSYRFKVGSELSGLGADNSRQCISFLSFDYTAAKIKAITDQYAPESLALGERLNLETQAGE